MPLPPRARLHGRCALLALLAVACHQAADTGEVQPETAETFGFPLVERELFDDAQRVGVDHDPVDHSGEGLSGDATCFDYLGRLFPWCYDEHKGTDYLLEGGFETMDAGSAQVVAAAAGVVIDVRDGNYDRCHVVGTEVSCDGHPIESNLVMLEHPSGILTRYGHLMKGSIPVTVGDEVECGDLLGLVGSSGISSTPHLHFQVERPDGVRFDPYAGPESQPESWWHDQGDPEGLPGDGCTAP